MFRILRMFSWSCALVAGSYVALATGETHAAVYNLHLATDNQPDYTDLDSYLHSATDAWETPAEKCIAIWRWNRRSRRQVSCAGEDGRLIWDPIRHFNSYGALNCGIVSSLNVTCFTQLGYRGRYIQLGDHTVCEASWDNGKTWHLFDSSMSIFCFNHAGEVASSEEIKESHACALSGGKSEPGHYYYYHAAPHCASHPGPKGWRCAADQPVAFNRTLYEGAASYTDGFSVDKYCQYARHGDRYTLNLRPYESYTRYWEPLDRALPGGSDPAYYRPVTAKKPDPNSLHPSIRGNGRWLFKPDLTNTACRKTFYDDSRVALRAEDGQGPQLHPTEDGKPAFVTFKVYAANVITSLAIDMDSTRANATDQLRVLVSRDAGLRFREVWAAKEIGPHSTKMLLLDEVAGVTQCLIKVEIQGGRHSVGVDSLAITTTTQVNRLTLPALALGANTVVLRADRQAEMAELWPALHAGKYRETVDAERDVFSDEKPDGMYKATLGPSVNGQECFAAWRLAVPTDITGVSYAVVCTNRSAQQWVALSHGWEREKTAEFYRKSVEQFPADEQVRHAIGGTEVPAGRREAVLRASFQTRSGAAAYTMPGIQSLLMRVEHKPRDAAFEPFEVTYRWTEHRTSGDVARQHTELVRQLPHRYTINVGGIRPPSMEFVRVSLQGHGPEGKVDRYGYSDGDDVGPAARKPKVKYAWGVPLSTGAAYVASRPSSNTSKNPDSGGELTNGAIIAPTDYTAANQAVRDATAFWEGEEPLAVTVDLKEPQKIAGVRVSTHQPNAESCHPARVAVEVSADGKAWQAAGEIQHDDIWNPPGDYEPWEYDDAPQYRKLPAGGRLAYSFPLVFSKPLSGRYVRFTCTPLPNCGMGLSELSVYDQVEVRPWPQREIVLTDQAP